MALAITHAALAMTAVFMAAQGALLWYEHRSASLMAFCASACCAIGALMWFAR